MLDSENEENQLSILTIIDNPIKADILKSLIEANGIACHLFDENILKQNPWYTTAIGGIKLMVPTEQLNQAQDIVNKLEQGDYALDDETYELLENEEQVSSTHQSKQPDAYYFFHLPKIAVIIIIIALSVLLAL